MAHQRENYAALVTRGVKTATGRLIRNIGSDEGVKLVGEAK